MFNGGTLLCLIVAIGAGIYLLWPWIVANLIVDIDTTHPDAYTTGDLRQRGWDEHEAHEAAMRARAEKLGYPRDAA